MASVDQLPANTSNKTLPVEPVSSVRISKQSRRSSAKSSEAADSSLSVRKSRSRRQSKTLYWTVPPPDLPASLENQRWHKITLDFARLNLEENQAFFDHAGRPHEVKPIVEPEKAYDIMLSRYVKYCVIAKKMDESFMYLVHPQKRRLLQACLGALINRILEIKDDLVQIDQREYHFLEDILQDYGLTHEQIEIKIPMFVRQERAQVLKEREKLLTLLFDKHTEIMSECSGAEDRGMSKSDAILLIQRQTRYYLGVIKSEMARHVLRPRSTESRHAIQRQVITRWKVYASRKETFEHKKNLDRLLMMIPEDDSEGRRSTVIIDKLAARNMAKAQKNEEFYENDKFVLQKELTRSEGPYVAWNLHYNIKQWLLEVRDILGKFPPFPDVEEGGSSLLFANKDLRDVAEELDINVVNGKVFYPKVEKPKKPKKVKKVAKPSPWGADGFEFMLEETDCMREMKARTMEYRDYWYYKDDSANLLQTHDRNLLKEQIRPLVHEDIRLQVDELIRAELENLIYAIDREPRPEPEKKKAKKEKEKKGKKNNDPTADRTIEELFEELVHQGIIRYSPQANLEDFLGEYSFTGSAMDQAKKDPPPSLADVRRMATEFAVLPLSSQAIHENAPLVRKLLIAGVRGTGKRLLLRAICHEVGANLFDLTPSNLEGKYDSPQGKKMLMHLIMKVGKAMEPSIFYVGDCEKMFLKKKDKADTSKPHQWAGVLNKTLKKGIKNGDRMMMIGTSSLPGLTKQGPFNKFFDRIIIIPHPDYSSRYMAWKYYISKHLGSPVPPYFDLGSLSKVTAGYTIATIKTITGDVLTEQRKAKFKFQPLQPADFINVIWKLDPIYVEEQEMFTAWYDNTPLAKQRQLRVHAEHDDEPKRK